MMGVKFTKLLFVLVILTPRYVAESLTNKDATKSVFIDWYLLTLNINGQARSLRNTFKNCGDILDCDLKASVCKFYI